MHKLCRNLFRENAKYMQKTTYIQNICRKLIKGVTNMQDMHKICVKYSAENEKDMSVM